MAYDSPTFEQITQTVLNYYDSGSEFWGRVNNGTASAAEIYDAYSRLPSFTIQRTIDGHIMGTDWRHGLNQLQYANPAESQTLNDDINQLFSNSASANYGGGNSYNIMVPGTWGGNGSNGYTNQAGTLITGGGSRLATIADKVSLALAGVNIGSKLGAGIDGLLYDLDPQWWEDNLPTINPQTWPSIAGESELGENFLRILFGVPDSNTVVGYLDERVLAQVYQLLRDQGFWTPSENASASYSGPTNKFTDPTVTTIDVVTRGSAPEPYGNYTVTASTSEGYFFNLPGRNSPTQFVSETPNATATRIVTYPNGSQSQSTVVARSTRKTLYSGKTIYYNTISGGNYPGSTIPVFPVDSATQAITILFDGTISSDPNIPGIRPISGATQYPPVNITGTTTQEILDELRQQYPDLFTDSITESVLQEDGTIEDRTYIPIPWGISDLGDTPTTSDNVTEDVKPDDFTEFITRDPTTNPPDTGTGTQSPFVMPSGSGSSLWAVYHPSQAQLNAFGAWLWSSDFVEQLKKLFNDPMQAVIGVHKVFAPIPTGETRTIVCGYLDSGVASPIVSSQYTSVDCGSVNCSEYFGNVFDYDPHTKVSIYLPFIGVVPLKVSEVMRSTINVTYGVDVITGACLAKVRVTRDGGGAIMYSYGGSCACHYPISSGSYAGIVSGIVTSAIGIAGGIATGNPLAAIGGAMAGLSQAHTEVQRSGGFTGCAGAMGPKKPYLIIDRPQTRMATDYEDFQGDPTNSTQFIKDCSGFIRVKEIHFASPGAYDDEVREIEDLLKSGIQTGTDSNVVPVSVTEIEP